MPLDERMKEIEEKANNLIFSFLGSNTDFLFSVRKQIAERTVNKMIEEIEDTEALFKAYKMATPNYDWDKDEIYKTDKHNKLLKVENIGNRKPYYDKDADRIDKIKHICEWLPVYHDQDYNFYSGGVQDDKLIDIVIYSDEGKEIEERADKILEIMKLKKGYKKADIMEILTK